MGISRMADALTSVTAIAALLAGKYLGWNRMDPAMGIVGSLVVAVPALRWAILLGGTGYLLWLARRLWGSRSLTSVWVPTHSVTPCSSAPTTGTARATKWR